MSRSKLCPMNKRTLFKNFPKMLRKFVDETLASETDMGKKTVFVQALFTLTLQESRVPQICGVKGEAVVLYREPLTTKEMWYPRLSHRVNNMAVFRCFQDFTWSAF